MDTLATCIRGGSTCRSAIWWWCLINYICLHWEHWLFTKTSRNPICWIRSSQIRSSWNGSTFSKSSTSQHWGLFLQGVLPAALNHHRLSQNCIGSRTLDCLLLVVLVLIRTQQHLCSDFTSGFLIRTLPGTLNKLLCLCQEHFKCLLFSGKQLVQLPSAQLD